jgi:putative Ca2+/H+ antiporter (TMEM165/GDT1 family)
MEWKLFATAFVTLFLAELGDKTQLAVITMTAKNSENASQAASWLEAYTPHISVFLGASLALVLLTLLGVVFGGVLTQYVPTDILQKIVAGAFIGIGVLMLLGKL